MDPNPIAVALEKLSVQWRGFARDDEPRLLVWQATSDETALVDAFVARECDAKAAETDDVFVQLSAPFEREATHGLALAHELSEHYEQLAAGFDEAARATRWHAPHRERNDVAGLLETLTSFRSHHVPADAAARLAVWLRPQDVADMAGYLRWLQQLVQQAPPELRFFSLALDDAFAPLCDAESKRIARIDCDLAFPQALEAIAEAVPQKTPGDVLRVLQTKLAAAVQAGDITLAEALATQATELATQQAWPQLAAGVQMMLAAGYHKCGRSHDAVATYARAEGQLRKSEDAQASTPASSEAKATRHVRMSAVFGRATTLLKLSAYQHAADAYLEGAALARASEDARLELDGYRLAAFSHELAGDIAKAWQLGKHALSFAFTLDEETQKSSSLPYLAQQQLRLARTQRDYADYETPLADEFRQRLGEGWEDQLVPAG